MDPKHELLQEIRRIAVEQGRTPTRKEFTDEKKCKYDPVWEFGAWTTFVSAAGLEPSNRRKIDNTVFEKDIQKHIEAYKAQPLGQFSWPTLATISDIHWPFCNDRVIDKFALRVEATQPEWIILNGDAWDMYSHTKFPRSHNVFTPREESKLSRKMNEEFWKEMKKRSPQSKCVQMLGNHDLRPLKRILEAYPAAEDWMQKALEAEFTFNGVRTIYDPREELIIGDIAVFHGYRTGLGAHRDFTLMNCINGHTHKGGTVFRPIRRNVNPETIIDIVVWELNSGFAGDPAGKGLTYTPQKMTDWTSGFGEVDSSGPRFIPC